MSDCLFFQELISRVLDGDLSPDEQETLNGHLSTCPECRALYQSFRAMSGALSGELEEPPARLRENVMAELRRAEIKKKNRPSRPVKILLSAAACVALIVGLSIGSNVLRSKDAELAASQDNSLVLAGSNFAATRRLPNGELRAAAYDAAEGAAEEEAVLVDAGVPAVDLSDRCTKEELLDFLGQGFCDLKELPSQPLYDLVVADGDGFCVVTVYEQDGQLIYTLPETGAYLADCTRQALDTFING